MLQNSSKCTIQVHPTAPSIFLHVGSLLHVCSGSPLESFPSLCSTYKCFSVGQAMARSAALRESMGLAGRCVTREISAAVEFWLATYADAFYGNVHSSFTVEQLATYRMLGKPAAYYNGVCSSPDDPLCV